MTENLEKSLNNFIVSHGIQIQARDRKKSYRINNVSQLNKIEQNISYRILIVLFL